MAKTSQNLLQTWERKTQDACLHLGEVGCFDDAHVLAPCVVYEQDRFLMWYSGAQGKTSEERVYGLGAAFSADGEHFERVSPSPIFEWPESGRSVLTPCLLRDADGTVLREDGALRMWISVTHFGTPSSPHMLHHMTSVDGMHWQDPSDALLEEVYAPTVIKVGETYQMWYVDVAMTPWAIRFAESVDGLAWTVHDPPVLQMDRETEIGYRNYPHVMMIDGQYCMWFSYVLQDLPHKMVGIGFAHSANGLDWTMSSQNPLIAPTADRPWESQYCGSPYVVKMPDGSFRVWYGSRHRDYPQNKYYAISTAQCNTWHFDGA